MSWSQTEVYRIAGFRLSKPVVYTLTTLDGTEDISGFWYADELLSVTNKMSQTAQSSKRSTLRTSKSSLLLLHFLFNNNNNNNNKRK